MMESLLGSRLTRRQLVQRGAAGVTLLSLPGLLAACGGGGGGGGSTRRTTSSTSRTGTLYIDVDEKTKKHPTLEQFTTKTGIKVNYFEDINDNVVVLREGAGPALAGPVDRPRHHRLHRQLPLPGLLIDKEWVREAQKDKIPNFSNLIDAQASPSFDPDRDVLACPGSPG